MLLVLYLKSYCRFYHGLLGIEEMFNDGLLDIEEMFNEYSIHAHNC